MTIRVAKHIRGSTADHVAYVGRTKSTGKLYRHAFHELANPFRVRMNHPREDVVKEYRLWLLGLIAGPTSAREQLLALAALHKKHGKLVIVCHCSPLACHGDVLKEFLEDMAEQREIEESKVKYCTNDPCETEAIKLCVVGKVKTPLCYTCSRAFQWGQTMPEATIENL